MLLPSKSKVILGITANWPYINRGIDTTLKLKSVISSGNNSETQYFMKKIGGWGQCPPGFDAPDQLCCPYYITDKAKGRSSLSANKQF